MQIRGGGGAPRGGGEQVVHGAEATKAWTEGAGTFSEVNGLVCRREQRAGRDDEEGGGGGRKKE